jgi:TolB-like protein
MTETHLLDHDQNGMEVCDQLTPDDVRAELAQLLGSPTFRAPSRRRNMLKFLVEETLAGRGNQLKGYTIGVSVFGRDENYDPQADPVVRMEARRLRQDLNAYYVDAGQDNPIRISIPKGRYVPRFQRHEPANASDVPASAPQSRSETPATDDVVDPPLDAGRAHPRSLHLLIGAIATSILIVVAAGWFLIPRLGNVELTASGKAIGLPAVVVLPFESLTPDTENSYLAVGLTADLIEDLMKFPSFRLYTLPPEINRASARDSAELGRNLGVAYVVVGSVREGTNDVRVAAQLLDAATGQVVWARTYDRPLEPEALIKMQSDLAGRIATELGQPYGVFNSELDSHLTTPEVSNMQSYTCVRRAYAFRRSFSSTEIKPVLHCLEEAVRRDPDYSDAWAMLGWVHADAGRNDFEGTGKQQDEYEQALLAATQALKIAPNNTMALKALAAVNYYLGRYDESERLGRLAIEINPHDPEGLAQLGLRLSIRGKFEEGVPMLKYAIERSVNPPTWYFTLIAIDLYLKGDYEQMLSVATRSAPDGRGISQALIAIAANKLGKLETARQALEKMLQYKSFARDPLAYYRRHGFIEDTTTRLLAEVEEARRVASGDTMSTFGYKVTR